MDQDGKPSLRKFSFEEDEETAVSRVKSNLAQVQAELQKTQEELNVASAQLKEKKIQLSAEVGPSSKLQALNFMDGVLTRSTYYGGITRADDGAILAPRGQFTIQMCCVRSFAGRIVDLYINAPGYIGNIEFIFGDCRQFDGPLEMLSRYKGSLMREPKIVVQPGIPFTLKGQNRTENTLKIMEATLVIEIDPEWERKERERNGYRP